MFSTKDYILIALSVITSVVANFLTVGSIHIVYLSVILVLLVVIYISNRKLALVRFIGIEKIERNISSESNTEKLLSLVKDSFFMLGRGGSRFVEANDLDAAVVRANRRKPIRFLLLRPGSFAAVELAKERNIVSTHISDIVSASLRTLDEYIAKGFNIEYRFYNNPKYVPIFRVVVIDDTKAYVSFYPRQETGKNSFQLVLFDSKSNNNLFTAFRLHFESMWEIAERPG